MANPLRGRVGEYIGRSSIKRSIGTGQPSQPRSDAKSGLPFDVRPLSLISPHAILDRAAFPMLQAVAPGFDRIGLHHPRAVGSTLDRSPKIWRDGTKLPTI